MTQVKIFHLSVALLSNMLYIYVLCNFVATFTHTAAFPIVQTKSDRPNDESLGKRRSYYSYLSVIR